MAAEPITPAPDISLVCVGVELRLSTTGCYIHSSYCAVYSTVHTYYTYYIPDYVADPGKNDGGLVGQSSISQIQKPFDIQPQCR